MLEYGKHGLSWACQHCQKMRYADLHPYTIKLLRLARLQQAGYPLEKNELTVAEWLDLARVKDVWTRLSDGEK